MYETSWQRRMAIAGRARARHKWVFALVAVLAVLAAAAMATAWYFGAGPGSKVVIPELAGQDIAAATVLLESSDLIVSPSRQEVFSTTLAPGGVIGTNPKAGQPVPRGDTVTLVVSLGAIPEVTGLSVDEAQKVLSDKGLVGSTSDALHDWSNGVPVGKVIGFRVLAGGLVVAPGSELQLIVSDGVEQVAIPDVVGNAWAETQFLLEVAGFQIEFYNLPSRLLDLIPKAAAVREISPGAGTKVDLGSTVNVWLRIGD